MCVCDTHCCAVDTYRDMLCHSRSNASSIPLDFYPDKKSTSCNQHLIALTMDPFVADVNRARKEGIVRCLTACDSILHENQDQSVWGQVHLANVSIL